MIREKVPSSPEALEFSDVYSWEHVVKDAEAILINSASYMYAKQKLQSRWSRIGHLILDPIIAAGLAMNGHPDRYGLPDGQ